MVIGELKPIEEIIETVGSYNKILTVGCAGCTAVCLAGGQREVDVLNTEIKILLKDKKDFHIQGYTIERQCETDFIAELDSMIDKSDAVLSMACGAGVQFVAERFAGKPVYPALNTTFIGVNRDIGWYEEACRSCGDCQLAYTGGICPVTKCSKSIFNGPCGGTNKGKCEVSSEIPCAWYEIYERLKKQNRLDNILKIRQPMTWKNQIMGTVIQKEYRDRYIKQR